MAESVEIRITATNGTQQVFRAIQQDADRLASNLKDAGRDGDKAFDDIERGAREASREMQNAERSAHSMGDRIQDAADTVDGMAAGLTALGGALIYSGQQAMNKERQIIALQRAYGDAADEMIQFAEELDNVTIFSDDDIREGERFFATLRNNYGLTIEEIQRLMTITADLASSANVSYADAANRVTAAIRGEAEAAEYLGLTLNQQSIDRQNLTLTMTNEEAARFRLNALYEQAAVYEGTAADMAASSVGTYADLTDRLQDAAAAVGAFIGPWGSVVSGMGLGLAGVTSLVGGLGKMVTAFRNSATAAAALQAATSPLVLTIGAAAAAGTLLGATSAGAWKAFREGEDVTERLGTAFAQLRTGDVITFFKVLSGGVDEANAGLQQLEGTLASLWKEAARQQVLGNEEVAKNLDWLADQEEYHLRLAEKRSEAAWIEAEASKQRILTGETQARAEQRLREEMELSNTELALRAEALDIIAAAYMDPTVNAEELRRQLAELDAQFTLNKITADQHTQGLIEIARQYGTLPGDIENTDAALQKVNATLKDGSAAILGLFGIDPTEASVSDKIQQIIENNEEAKGSFLELAEAMGDTATDAAEKFVAAMNEVNDLGSGFGGGAKDVLGELADRAAELREHMGNLGESGTEALLEIAEDARQARIEFIEAGNALAGWDDALSQLNMTSSSTEAMRFAENVQIANTALDNTFRIIVTNTDALGSTVQRTADWVDELAFAEDGWTRVHQLQADGFINEAQMNAVLEARTSILADNEHLQNDILTMQALQAPLIADMVDQQRQYVHELSNQSAEQQLIALGWMDSTTAAQAMEAQTLAAAAASGEFGAAGKQAVANWIEGAVQLNPILEQMLTDIGLVARDHEGNIVINWDNAEGTMSEIERLTESIVTLTDLLDDGVINGSVNFDVTGEENIDRIIDQVERVAGRRHNIPVDAETEHAEHQLQGVIDYLTELDGSTGTVTAVGIDDASDEINSVRSNLGDLDGDTATVTNIGIDDASDEINSVRSNLGDLDGDTATVTVNAINNAGAVLGSVAAQLAALDGRTATSYVTTVYSSSGQRTAFADGGTVWGHELADMVPHAANGRSVWVGEYGPELVTLPHGAQVTPHVASLSAAGGSGAHGGGDVTFNITVNGSNRDEIYDVFEREIVPEMLRALREQERALGV